jgi:hypothetical protein
MISVILMVGCHIIDVYVSPARKPIEPLQKVLPQLRAFAVPIIWLNWGNRRNLWNISGGLLHVYNSTGESVGLSAPLPKNGAKVLMAGS